MSDEHPTRPLSIPDAEPTRELETDGPPSDGPAPDGGSRRPLVLVAAVVGGLLLAGGIGAAIATGTNGDGDATNGTVVSDGPTTDTEEPAPTAPKASGDDASDVDGMLTAMDTARGVADGVPVGIEEQSTGTWQVELEDASGLETEVLVDGSGARVADQDDDGDGDLDGVELTREVVQGVVDAAEADTAGRVVLIETDAGAESDRFEVEVRTPDGRLVELVLGASYAITDRDEDDERAGRGNGKGNKSKGNNGNGKGNNGNGNGHRDD